MPKPFDFIRIRKSWVTFAFWSTHLEEKKRQFVAEIMHKKNNVFFTLDVWRSCCFSCERCSPFILFASQCIGRNFNDIQIRIMCVLRIYPDKANEAIQAISLWYFQPHIFSPPPSTPRMTFSFLFNISTKKKKKANLGECVFQCSLIELAQHTKIKTHNER